MKLRYNAKDTRPALPSEDLSSVNNISAMAQRMMPKESGMSLQMNRRDMIRVAASDASLAALSSPGPLVSLEVASDLIPPSKN